MTTITVECPNCRLIENVPAAGLLLELGEPINEQDSGGATATWVCDPCMELVTLPVELSALPSLFTAGVALLDTHPDDCRPVYPESAVEGDLFTHDDLIEFHELMTDDLWLAEELNSEAQQQGLTGSGH